MISLGIEQAVQMDDKVAHLGVIDGRLRLGLPGGVGGRVVRVDADNLDLVEILEGVVLEIVQLAANDEMKQLPRGAIRHGSFSKVQEEPGKQ